MATNDEYQNDKRMTIWAITIVFLIISGIIFFTNQSKLESGLEKNKTTNKDLERVWE